jgi:hypothetical protein
MPANGTDRYQARHRRRSGGFITRPEDLIIFCRIDHRLDFLSEMAKTETELTKFNTENGHRKSMETAEDRMKSVCEPKNFCAD